jgi:hypothetical protein
MKNIFFEIKKKRAKKECDKKCQRFVYMAMKAEVAGDSEFAKELIHKQVETEMEYKDKYVYKQ